MLPIEIYPRFIKLIIIIIIIYIYIYKIYNLVIIVLATNNLSKLGKIKEEDK